MYTEVDNLGLLSSFRHNFTGASYQKTSLTKVVKEYALLIEMLCRLLKIE